LSAFLLLVFATAVASDDCENKNFVVAIDIGHSREKPGATSARGITEFSFNHNLAKVVLADLYLRGFSNSFLIEEHGGDHSSLSKRTAFAREKKAQLLLSIHHDSVQPQFLSFWTYQGLRLPYSDKFRGYSIFYSEKNQCAKASLGFSRLLGSELRKRGFVPTLHHAEKLAGENRYLVDKERGIYRFERIEHESVCACPACGGTVMTMIGADEREVLEYVRSHFKAIVHVRPKWSCRACETITQPPMPSLPIERGLPGPGLLAHVIISKYCDHLPLYRQSGIYARSGVDIDRSTMADWVGSMAFLLEPLSRRIAQHVRAGAAIHADDTPVPVLDPGRNRAKTGRLWVAVRDERPWGSGVPPAVFYRYAPDQKGAAEHGVGDQRSVAVQCFHLTTSPQIPPTSKRTEFPSFSGIDIVSPM
jgi:transposase